MWSGPRSLSVPVIALTEKQPGSHVLLACQDGPDTPSVASQAPRPRPPTETAAVLAESVPPARLAALPPVASPSPDRLCTGDPELFFTESPGDAETAKPPVPEVPGAGRLPRRSTGAAGALGSLGRRALPARDDRAPQAAAGTAPKDGRGCLAASDTSE
jgi:hypothetical protein